MLGCPMCAGIGYLMGVLGRLAWFRCRHCGIEFNLPANTLADDTEDGNNA